MKKTSKLKKKIGGPNLQPMKTATAIGIISIVLGLPGLAAERNQGSPSGSAPPVAGGSGPKIVFATPVHDFGRVRGGEVVKYTYIFTNVGGATLHVSNVQVSCGCTTAGEWTRQVEPGNTGSIPIQFNSASFSGAVGKSITVTCNDTNQPMVVLQIKADIWKPIEVTPQFAVLNVTADAPSNSTSVRIVSNEQEQLTLSLPESNNRAFVAELRTIQPGKEFQLIVKTAPTVSTGNVQGVITLKTSSTNMPVINVTAWANMQQGVMVTPPQIVLPGTTLSNALSSTISVRNNGANPLVLSEPAVNVKGVDVQLRELQPGRYFMLTMSFPAGFEMAQGQKIELSFKSNHPQFPTIKVPVIAAKRL